MERLEDAKLTESLPDGGHVGPCWSCQHWDAPTPRTEAMLGEMAVCLFRELRRYALVVSASSACNQWIHHPEGGSASA